jgi:lipopolysaccharide biosynthesis regulator YciM
MTPNDIAGLVGAALAGAAGTGAVFVKFALPWFKQRDRDVSSIKTEVGVGSVGPSIVELVGSTATAVQRLEQGSQRNGEGIHRVIETLTTHGERLTDLEDKHARLNDSVSLFHAAFTAHDLVEMVNRKHASKKTGRP